MSNRVSDLFFENVKKDPNKTAIICDGRVLSYKEMSILINKISNLLLESGVRFGDHIAFPMNNSIESVALIFSASEIGVCLVPINPTLPFEAIKTAISFSDSKHIIARKSFLNEFIKHEPLPTDGSVFCLDDEFENAIPFAKYESMPDNRPNLNHEFTGDESLILTLTSGSTGNPKPIDLSQNNKIKRSLAHIELYGLNSDDIVLTATPLFHSLAERLVILPLILGATSLMLPRFTPELWVKCVKEYSPTFTIAVSVQLVQILEYIKSNGVEAISSFKTIVSSSALLEENVKHELLKILPCQLHEMYGTSETSTVSDVCFNSHHDKVKSVGSALPNVKIRIVRDEDDGECKPFEIGEITVQSPLLCKGYYKQDSLMKNAMVNNYFRTGDLGYFDNDGYLYFAGRKKELIITGAINVYPNDIDEIVSKMNGVGECAAFSYPDEKLGEVVAIAIVKDEDSDISVRDVKIYCARHLADFQQPHKIFFVDYLPKNTLGKLQRNCIIDLVKD